MEIRKRELKNMIKYSGFTFVEFMIVIAIMGSMGSVGFVSLQSSKSVARLKAAQRNVVATIKQAQSYALQGQMRGASTPCEYGFKFTSTKAYQIFYRPPVGGSCAVLGAETPVESFVLNDNVVLSQPTVSIATNTKIRFTIPFGDVTIPTVPTTFAFQSPAVTGATKSITISQNGSVTEN